MGSWTTSARMHLVPALMPLAPTCSNSRSARHPEPRHARRQAPRPNQSPPERPHRRLVAATHQRRCTPRRRLPRRPRPEDSTRHSSLPLRGGLIQQLAHASVDKIALADARASLTHHVDRVDAVVLAEIDDVRGPRQQCADRPMQEHQRRSVLPAADDNVRQPKPCRDLALLVRNGPELDCIVIRGNECGFPF